MKIEWRNKEILKELKEPITDHIKKVGFKVENKTKELLSTEYTFQGKHLPAPKGKPPSLDTGRLRASISTNWTDSRLGNGMVGPEAKRKDGIKRPSKPFTVAVGTNVEYGFSLEMGHGCYPHPYLRPAFESVKASEGLK